MFMSFRQWWCCCCENIESNWKTKHSNTNKTKQNEEKRNPLKLIEWEMTKSLFVQLHSATKIINLWCFWNFVFVLFFLFFWWIDKIIGKRCETALLCCETYPQNEIRLIEWERKREKGREKAEEHLILCYYYARVLYGCFVWPTYSKYSVFVSLSFD